MSNIYNQSTSVVLPADDSNLPKSPSPREIETLQYVANGEDSKSTAKLMGISKRTVDFHLANVYDKLGVSNRMQACNAARAKGYIR